MKEFRRVWLETVCDRMHLNRLIEIYRKELDRIPTSKSQLLVDLISSRTKYNAEIFREPSKGFRDDNFLVFTLHIEDGDSEVGCCYVAIDCSSNFDCSIYYFTNCASLAKLMPDTIDEFVKDIIKHYENNA